MKTIEPGEDENIGDHVNHAEDEFEGLEDSEDMTTIMKQKSGKQYKISLDYDNNQAYLTVSQGTTNVQIQEQTQEPMTEEHHRKSLLSLSLMDGETSKQTLASTVNECPRHPTQDFTGVPVGENNIRNVQCFVINSLNHYITNFTAWQLLYF